MQRGLSDLNVTVKAIGVWDTVGTRYELLIVVGD
jgi:hypothetical protein